MKTVQTLESRRFLAATLVDGVLTVVGTSGNDDLRVFAGANNDIIARTNVADQSFPRGDVTAITLDGFRGNDLIAISQKLKISATLTGSAGSDTLMGGGASDSINGSTGNDSLLGGPGNDLLDGDYHDDTLNGEDGDDTLIGRFGRNAVAGGAGVDVSDYGWISATTSERMRFNDFERSNQPVGIFFTAGETPNVYSQQGLDDVAVDVDAIAGTRFRDIMTGGNEANIFRGRGGPDTMYGGGGADSLFGDDGTDNIFGEAGDDFIDLGAGDDNGVGGLDVDTILCGDGNDRAEGNAGRDTINGGAGNDTLFGSPGKDTLNGGTGDDQLFGGPDAADRILGGPGGDSAADDDKDSYQSVETLLG
jgi:Ca2+-binding RTX toxin-like protein